MRVCSNLSGAHKLPVCEYRGTLAEVSSRWKKWLRSFTYMAERQGITDTKRLKNLVLHTGGTQVQDLFEDLDDPLATALPADDDEYKVALRKLTEHFKAAPHPVYECHVLRQVNFMKSESVSQFVVRSCVQARLCDSGSGCDDMIRDHVVSCIFEC